MTGTKWDFACDSYGKVQHSKKACAFTVTTDDKGRELIVKIAAQIANWDDARLIASAPDLLAVLKDVAAMLPVAPRLHPQDMFALQTRVCDAIKKAEGAA